jgi:hypothetical protein
MKYFAKKPKTQYLETPTKILTPKSFGFGVHLPKNLAKLFRFPSHRILRHMCRALNIDKK